MKGNLAISFSLKSIWYHKLVSFATILGIAMGVCAVSSIMIVDKNTERNRQQYENIGELGQLNIVISENKSQKESNVIYLPIKDIEIISTDKTANDKSDFFSASIPTQQIAKRHTLASKVTPKGEEDYQIMRIAIRMASVIAFLISAVIVFYTMRFSVASRIKEFALLLCLGEEKKNVSLSLLLESLILSVIGSSLGLILAIPVAYLLLGMGISTTGRTPLSGFSIPETELAIMYVISLSVALLGVVSPIISIYRLKLSQVLQPRFLPSFYKTSLSVDGISWLIPPLLLTTYIAIRPFLASWLSVIYFFLVEAFFALFVMLVTLWWSRPFLRLCIKLLETLFKSISPLYVLLSIKRMRLNSDKYVFTITGVVIIFGLVFCLHGITRSIKHEIYAWSSEALTPYFFYIKKNSPLLDDEQLQKLKRKNKIYVIRLSAKSHGIMPFRIVNANDYNEYRRTIGKPAFKKNQVIFSRTMAARFGVNVGDYLRIDTDKDTYQFKVAEITDEIGTLVEDSQYINIKSFVLFADGTRLFKNNLESTLGNYAVVRSADFKKPQLWFPKRQMLLPFYQFEKAGRNLKNWQLREIDKDFLIFDFIFSMTVVLSCLGVVNTLLIQVYSREREISVLKSLGVSQVQMLRLFIVEGFIIGVVGAILAMILGTALGMISVTFLDRYTLFHYQYLWSYKAILLFSGLTVIVCCISAIYPAKKAARISASESLHYE